MDKIIVIFTFLTAFAVMILAFPDGILAVLLTAVVSVPVIILIRQNTDESHFLIQLFLAALSLRMLFGVFIHAFDLRGFFGADAITYDFLGKAIIDYWFNGAPASDMIVQKATSTGTPGWGMNYLTAIIYMFTGRNLLAAQSFCAVVGAATAPMVYVCAHRIFHNTSVSKNAALMVALFPAFIIWSGQFLKDGLIIFLLVLAMTMVLQLQEKLNYFAVIFLVFALFGILSLRFYIFYMVAISVAGSFIIGQSGSAKSIARGFIILIVMGVALTYLGVLRTASENFDKWGSLESIQRSRSDLSKRGDSGFGGDVDVSTTEGAITIIPLGFTYLMLAPFPWQLGSLRQAITIPEMIVWWCSIPLMIVGLIYTIKNRLRNAIAVLIFTLMLTLAYSIFQGNVGTAYRQRTQIQVFLFIFIAVGWTLRKEKRENKRLMGIAKRERLENHLKANRLGDSNK
jgi:hypothetical protein